MLMRRVFVGAASAALAMPAAAAPGFAAFLAGVRAEARARGIAPRVIAAALGTLAPNQDVLARERHQPEFTMTWARYRHLLLTEKRIAAGRAAYRAHADLFASVRRRFGVEPGVILGIWGLESNYGATQGAFRVVDALATLAWASGRPAFFRGELMAALEILNHGDIAPAAMTGSYAGAMGQPQFMPSSYLRYAVDITGSGRRDIWGSVPDVIASIANYLASNGWRAGQGWGFGVRVPRGGAPLLGAPPRSLAGWRALGVVPFDSPRPLPAGRLSLLRPGGPEGPAYLVTADFAAIRRYNPSDFYALLVGLLGDRIVA
ncbi:MAG: lytic murein transglycosylase [Rhodospirillales bacterium]|nr:lytic murein transglycosylase [Rhodospirillales bacterium]